MMLALRLPEDMNTRLAQLARKTGRSKSYYVRKALNEFLEDREDYLLAVAALEDMKRGNSKTYTLDEVKKELGLDD